MPDGTPSFALPPAAPRIAQAIARAIAPRKPLTVSAWADAERVLSSKGSAEPGRWRTSRNPMLREPMDCMSKRSRVHEVVVIFPIQIGKTEFELNALGYCMDHDPGPIMVVLPDDITLGSWTTQKLNPLLDETPAIARTLTSNASRNSANQKAFKDFAGGQLYVEHGKTPSRMALKSIRTTLVDELDKFAAALPRTGEDPLELIRGRNSAFPSTYKRAFCGTPGIKGLSKLEELWEGSDQRLYRVPCPHCGEYQPLLWSGLHWSADGKDVWYTCAHNGCVIREHDKPGMFARGRWVPQKPDVERRGYRLNCLYYPLGLGPRWHELVAMWRGAQGDPAKLQVFVCERLAEAWEDPAMRAVKQNIVQDRAEPYKLRTAIAGVLGITAGVDTQDNRLAVQIVGWGRDLKSWTLDYLELPGDPQQQKVWDDLTDLLMRPLEHVRGVLMPVEAVAIDAGGHRTEAVKHYVRLRRVRRPLCIFGAVPNNAPVLSKGKLEDVKWNGKQDRRGVIIHHVGTVAIKHLLYGRLSVDADPVKLDDGSERAREPAERLVHFSDQLDNEYFAGLTSETYNARKNRFDKIRTRNEPLDTWVYAYAATHHPELRLHRLTNAEWSAREARLQVAVAESVRAPEKNIPKNIPRGTNQAPARPAAAPTRTGFASDDWSSRL
jgi:phage terminase large subunit GpA-like protein